MERDAKVMEADIMTVVSKMVSSSDTRDEGVQIVA